MYRAVLALIARRSRDGLGVTPLLQLARTTLVWRVGLAIVAGPSLAGTSEIPPIEQL